MHNCLRRSVPEMHAPCCWDVKQPTITTTTASNYYYISTTVTTIIVVLVTVPMRHRSPLMLFLVVHVPVHSHCCETRTLSKIMLRKC